jgi:hypothetical protein
MADESVRRHLIELLRGGQAHLTFEDAVKDFPFDKTGIRPDGSPHSAWELLEHIRIAQRDIVLFSGAMESWPVSAGKKHPKDYTELKWPDDYWPASSAPRDAAEWGRSVAATQEDLASFITLVEDKERPLTEPFPWGQGQTLLREALLIADHNSYHVGQLVLVRRMLVR